MTRESKSDSLSTASATATVSLLKDLETAARKLKSESIICENHGWTAFEVRVWILDKVWIRVRSFYFVTCILLNPAGFLVLCAFESIFAWISFVAC
jgi:hypothetical protein